MEPPEIAIIEATTDRPIATLTLQSAFVNFTFSIYPPEGEEPDTMDVEEFLAVAIAGLRHGIEGAINAQFSGPSVQ